MPSLLAPYAPKSVRLVLPSAKSEHSRTGRNYMVYQEDNGAVIVRIRGSRLSGVVQSKLVSTLVFCLFNAPRAFS